MAKKSKKIDALQRRHARDMLKVYRKRANEVKAALVKVIKSGGDSTVLRQEKAKINNVIKRLNKELKKLAKNQVDSSYFDGREEALKDFERLNVDKFENELNKNQPIKPSDLTALDAEYINHTEWLVRQLDKDVKGFLRTGFDNVDQVVRAINKLTKNQVVIETPPPITQTENIRKLSDFGGQVLSSQTTQADWAALAKSIEQKFYRRDVFTVPYFNKNKEVVRNVKVKSYAEMLARTMTAITYREAAQKAILDKFGNLGDLVEIMGDSDYHECDECKQYEHQILSLTGQTKGYTTIDEAKEQGLFHPNCIHWFEVTDKVLDEYEGLKGDKPKNKKEIKYDGRLESINKAFSEHYDKAKSLVKDIRNKVFKKGMKAGEYQKAALDYLREKIPEETKKETFRIGTIPQEIKTALGAKNDDLLVSIETLTKNVIKHEEMSVDEYLKINQYLRNADALFKKQRNRQALQVIAFKQDNAYYQIVLKSTLDKRENFLQSFHKTDLTNIKKELSAKTIKIIKNNLNKNTT